MGVPGGDGSADFRLAHRDQAVHGGNDARIVMERRGRVGFRFGLLDRRFQGRHGGLAGRDFAFRDLQLGLGGVKGRLGDIAGLEDLQVPLVVALGQPQVGLGLDHIGLGPGQITLGPVFGGLGGHFPGSQFNRIQFSQELAFLHPVALIGVKLFQDPGDLGAHRDRDLGLHRARAMDCALDLHFLDCDYRHRRAMPDKTIGPNNDDDYPDGSPDRFLSSR